MLKHIPTSWRDDMRLNFAHPTRFYINPRGRVLPAMTSAGVTYIKNDKSSNFRGTWRMQTGATTDLTYLYTIQQAVIVEGWFKPEFAFDVASDQVIFSAEDPDQFSLVYDEADDTFDFYCDGAVKASSTAYTTNQDLQTWKYIRLVADPDSGFCAFYMVCNGVTCVNSSGPLFSNFVPLNTISFCPGVDAELSYWIIHEPEPGDYTLTYATHEADRQIMFDFNGTTLGRERIYIPLLHDAEDTRGVKSYAMHKSVENPMTGSAGANSAEITLLNINGQFSDDQYDAFDPYEGYYNGTEKYLQNRVGVEVESGYSETINVRDGLLLHYSFDDGTGKDNSGLGREATVTGATPVSAISGSGLEFAGDDTTYVRTDATINTPDEFTICGWVNSTSQLAYTQSILNTDAAARLGVGRLASASIAFFYYTGSSVTVAFTDFFTDDMWIHFTIIGSWTTGVINCYKNGTFFKTGTMSGQIKPSALTWTIGNRNSTSATAGWLGYIDEFRAYNRILTGAEIAYLYANPTDWGTSNKREPMFIGRTMPGAFRRSSPDKFYGEVQISVEDVVSELGETTLNRAYTFDAHDISNPANETDSLVHDIVRLVTKKTIKNYALNSSIENDTIANSWTNTGMDTFERSDTYAQFGTYSMKCIADAAADIVTQVISFEGDDLIDVGDIFNFSAYVRQGTASTVRLTIEELDASDSLLGTGSSVDCGTDTGLFTRVDVARTVLDADCTKLRITFYAVDASTFYVDGVMLTRGIDPIDYFLLNATDGASGEGTSADAATAEYDTVGIDADAVDLEHPYVMLDKGSTAWEALKEIGDASIATYTGMTADGTFRFASRYAETVPPTNGAVEGVASVGAQLDVDTINAVKVHGVIIKKESTAASKAIKQIWSGEASGIFANDEGGKMLHPIASGSNLTVSGSTTIEAVYQEDV